MSIEAVRGISTVRKGAIEGLDYAVHLVNYFGWAPPSPEDHHLNLGTTLNLAACKVAVEVQRSVYDVEALMGYLLEEYLKSVATNGWRGLVDWECMDGRTAEEIVAALQGAAASS